MLELRVGRDLLAVTEASARGARLTALVLAGQQPGCEREERHEAEAEALTGRQHVGLGVADEQAVLVLDRLETNQTVRARHLVRLRDLRGREVRGADRANRTGPHQLIQRLQRLQDRCDAVRLVVPVDVDHVGSQPPQRRLYGVADVVA